MAKKVLIDELVSPIVAKQMVELDAGLDRIIEKIVKINTKNIGSDSKSITEAGKQTQAYANEVDRLNYLQSEAGVILTKKRQAVSEDTRMQKLASKATNDQISDYERLKAQMEIALYNYRKLAAEYGKNSSQARAAATEAKRLVDQINGINNKVGLFQGTVGKYTDSIMNSFKQIGLAIVAAFSFQKVVGFFKSGIEMSMAWEERNARMLFTLNNNADAMERMQKVADGLAKKSLFKKSDIVDAQVLALQLGRTEEQTNKMITAAMGLARVTGQDLSTAMQTISMTLEGSKGRLGRIVGEIKNMTEEELRAGKAIDVINERFGRFGREGLETTKGRVVMLSKEWAGFQRKLVEGTGGKNIFAGIIDGARSLVGWLNNNIQLMGKIITEIGRFLTVVIAWKVGVMAASAAQTVWATATNLYTVAANRAKVATEGLNTAQKSNIWGLVASAIALAITYLVQYVKTTKDINKLEKEIADEKNSRLQVQKKAAELYGEETGKIEAYRVKLKAAYDDKKKFSEVVEAYNNDIGIKYGSTIDAQTASLLSMEKQLKRVRDAIIAKAITEAAEEEITKLGKRLFEDEKSLKLAELTLDIEKKRLGVLKDIDISKGLETPQQAVNDWKNEINNSKLAIIELSKYIEEKKKLFEANTDLQKSTGGVVRNLREEMEKWEQLLSVIRRYSQTKKGGAVDRMTILGDPADIEKINELLDKTVENVETIVDGLGVKQKFIWENIGDSLDKVMPDIEKYVNYIQSFIGAIFDAKSVQNENALIAVNKQAEEELAILEKKYKDGLILEADYLAQKEGLTEEAERKRLVLAKQRFEQDKKEKMIQMGIDQIMAQMNIYATVTPWYAAVAQSAAMGIIFTALFENVRKSQFPGYEKGRKGGKGEFAWVGEKGYEYISTDTGIFKTPNTKTFTYLPENASVLPHNVSKELNSYIQMPTVNSIQKVENNSSNKEMLGYLRQIAGKQTAQVSIDKNGISVLTEKAGLRTKFLNSNVIIN